MYHIMVLKSIIIENKKCKMYCNSKKNSYLCAIKIAGRNKAIKLIKNPLSLIQTSTPDDVIGGILFL